MNLHLKWKTVFSVIWNLYYEIIQVVEFFVLQG
jgi:hypothetical protein